MTYEIDQVDVKNKDLFLIFQEMVTDLGAIRTKYNAAQVDLVELRTSVLELTTDVAAIRTQYNAAQVDLVELRTSVLELAADDAAMKTFVDNARTLVLNQLQSEPIIAPGTTATKVKTTAAANYTIAGVHYVKAATDDIAAPGAGANTDGTQYRKTLVSVNAAGTVTFTHGATAASQGAAALPATPASNIPLGYLEIPVSFTSGSTSVTSGMCKPWADTLTAVASPTVNQAALTAAQAAAATVNQAALTAAQAAALGTTIGS